jgi:hypothetical protein
LQAQKTHLSHYPYPGLFRPRKRVFAKAGVQATNRWRPLYNSSCSLIRVGDLEK